MGPFPSLCAIALLAVAGQADQRHDLTLVTATAPGLYTIDLPPGRQASPGAGG
jgi:hypothetical protein